MLDGVAVLAMTLLFVLALLYVRGADRLKGPRS